MGQQLGTKLPCPVCKSSDGATEYESDDGKVFRKCFAGCGGKQVYVRGGPEDPDGDGVVEPYKREAPVVAATADRRTLAQRGARHHPAPDWTAKVVVDGRLVTGQNPQSAAGVGRAMRELLIGSRP